MFYIGLQMTSLGAWVEYDLSEGGCFAITTLAEGVQPSSNSGGSIAFEVEDLEKLVQQLKANKVDFKLDIFSSPVCKMAVILDSEELQSKTSEKLWFIFIDKRLLLTQKMEILKENDDFTQSCSLLRKLQLDYSDSPHMVLEIASDTLLPKELHLKDLKELYHLLPPNIMALAGKAFQLIEWDKSHQYCGECGSRTDISENEHSRTCANILCKRIHYPRISPVVIVAVERGNEILLARSPHFPSDIYSVLAGFVEPGESIEQAVHREVFEETGIKVKNLRYFASQPWPFSNSLMLGFQSDFESGDIICAQNEIEDAAFFHVNALPETFPGNFTLSQWLLRDFCKRRGRII